MYELFTRNEIRAGAKYFQDLHWNPRSSAMAAGLTDYIWTIGEVTMIIIPLGDNT